MQIPYKDVEGLTSNVCFDDVIVFHLPDTRSQPGKLIKQDRSWSLLTLSARVLVLRDLLPCCDLLDPVLGHPSPLCRVKLHKFSSLLWSFCFSLTMTYIFSFLLSYLFIGTFVYLLFDRHFAWIDEWMLRSLNRYPFQLCSYLVIKKVFE